MSDPSSQDGTTGNDAAAAMPVHELQAIRQERNQLVKQLTLERENLRRAQQRIVQLRAEADEKAPSSGAATSQAIYETAIQEAQRRYSMLQAQLLREREFRDQMQQNIADLMAALSESENRALEYSQSAISIRKAAAQRVADVEQEAERDRRTLAEKEHAWSEQRAKLNGQVSELLRNLEMIEQEQGAKISAAAREADEARRELAAREQTWSAEKAALTDELTALQAASAQNVKELQTRVGYLKTAADEAQKSLSIKEKAWAEEKRSWVGEKAKFTSQISQLMNTLEQSERDQERHVVQAAPQNAGQPDADASKEANVPAQSVPAAPMQVSANEMNVLPRMQLGPSARKSGDTVISTKGQSGHVVFGPYFRLTPGAYRASFRITPVNGRWFKGAAPVCAVEILSNDTYLGQIHLTEKELSKDPAKLEFVVPPELGGREFEFRVWTSGEIELCIHELSFAANSGSN